MKAVTELKNDMDVIDTLSIYDSINDKFIHDDPALPNLSFFLSVAESGVWEDTQLAFFQVGGKWLYVTGRKSVFVFISLKEIENVNRILLGIKTQSLLPK